MQGSVTPSYEEDIPTITFDCFVMDVAFHPIHNVVAGALVDGRVELFRYIPGATENEKVMSRVSAKDSVRSIQFSADGNQLFGASSDRTAFVFDATGNITWRAEKVHKEPVNVISQIQDSVIVTGGDDGGIKIWDVRANALSGPVVEFNDHEDVVTAFHVDMDRHTLLSTGGDGTLGVYDIRRNKLAVRTEQDEEELLSIAVLGSRQNLVVTGTQDGILLLWDWGKWTWSETEYHQGPERFTGHPQSIDSILVVDEDTIITGSSDGLVRLLTLRPNKLVGIVAEHGEGDEPIERMAWSRDKKQLATISHDCAIRFWDTAYLFETTADEEGTIKDRSRFVNMPSLTMDHGDSDDDSDDDSDEEDAGEMDMDGSDEDGDSDDDGDAGVGGSGGRGNRRAMPFGNKAKKSKGSGFYDDM